MLNKKKLVLLLLITAFSGIAIIDQIQSDQQPITISNSHEIATKPPKYTGIVAKVDNIAEKITVKIAASEGDSHGSGVILARQGNTYYVVTAGHVMDKDKTYQLVTPDGKTYQLDNQNTVRSDAYDLAIFSFESERDYTVATVGNYAVAVGRNQAVFVSGFVNSTENANIQQIVTGGKVFQNNNALGLVYRNISYPGMSGGAILDREGRLVGINIGTDEQLSLDDDNYENLAIGYSSGIPIYENILGFLKTQTQLKTEWLDITDSPAREISNIEWNRITSQLLDINPPSYSNTDPFAWINYGDRQWRYERYEQAIKALKQAVSINPEFDRAYYTMGYVYWEQDLDPIEALEKATEINPNISSYWLLLGSFYSSLGNRYGYLYGGSKYYKKAISAYEQGIAVNPQDYVLYVQLGLTLQKTRRYEEAITAISKAIEIKPNLPKLYNDRGIIHATSQRHDEALVDYNKAISLNPLFTRAYNNRGGTYNDLQQYENALADFNQAISLDLNYAEAYQNRGNAYYYLRQYENALASYNKAIAINPEFTTAYYGRSYVYAALGQYEKAETDKQSIREINSGSVRELNLDPESDAAIYYQRGINHLRSNENEEAIADFTQAISHEPNYEEVYDRRAFIYHHYLGQYNKAIDDYTQIIAINSESTSAYNGRAEVYKELEQYDKAIADYTQTIAINPEGTFAYSGLAEVYQELEQYDKAITAYTQLIAVDLNSTFAYHNRAYFYKKLGQYDKAIVDYTQLIAADLDSSYGYRNRAYLYQELRQYDRAIADFTQAISLDPEDVNAQNGRAKIYQQLMIGRSLTILKQFLFLLSVLSLLSLLNFTKIRAIFTKN